jgi:hypothetical protein
VVSEPERTVCDQEMITWKKVELKADVGLIFTFNYIRKRFNPVVDIQ